MLCHSSAKEEAIHVLKDEDCALQSLHDLDDLVDVANSDEERQIIVVFHNLKGFDGMLILHELYQQTAGGGGSPHDGRQSAFVQ